jgi:hypothetical protein
MRLFVNHQLWDNYYVYEPTYDEFGSGLSNLDPSDPFDQKKYHYRFCEFINSNSQDDLVEMGFSEESAIKLKDELELFADYPIYEVFEEGADFSLSEEEEGWQWEKNDLTLRIFKQDHSKLIEFIIENLDEEDGSSYGFGELNVIIETSDGELLRGDEVTANDFNDGTKIIGFGTTLEKRYFFSKENAWGTGGLEDLIPLTEHKDYSIKTLDDFIAFIEKVA